MATSMIITIQVTKKGERHYFQVNIPQDTISITGIEATVSGITLPNLMKDLNGDVAGTIKLQAENRPGLSFVAQVWAGAHPVEQVFPGMADLHGEICELFPFPYYCNEYSETTTSREVDSYMLYGCYEDVLGRQLSVDAKYSVALCLHLKQQ